MPSGPGRWRTGGRGACPAECRALGVSAASAPRRRCYHRPPPWLTCNVLCLTTACSVQIVQLAARTRADDARPAARATSAQTTDDATMMPRRSTPNNATKEEVKSVTKDMRCPVCRSIPQVRAVDLCGQRSHAGDLCKTGKALNIDRVATSGCHRHHAAAVCRQQPFYLTLPTPSSTCLASLNCTLCFWNLNRVIALTA